jgi:hypothetical protein
MAYEKLPPEWNNTGTEPPQTKKDAGFDPGEKPPAQWFNWLFNKIYQAIQELQGKAVEKNQIPYVFTATSTVENQYAKYISDITGYYNGLQILVTFPSTNTGSASINISNLGYKSIKKVDASGNIVSLVAGDIRINQPMLFIYNGIEFVSLGYSSADQVNIKDNGNIITATNVEGALQEVKGQINTHENAADPHQQYATDEALSSHLADIVADVDGVHGLKIEKGTFTPTLAGQTTSGVNTYTIQTGYYTLIDKRLHFDIYITLSAKDAAMAGNILITGLPFVSKNDINRRIGVAVGFFANIDTDATRPIIGGQIIPNASYILTSLSGDNIISSALQSTQIMNTTALILSGNYEIN